LNARSDLSSLQTTPGAGGLCGRHRVWVPGPLRPLLAARGDSAPGAGAVRLVILALVDDQGRGLLLGAAVGPPYASEIRLLREMLDTLEDPPPLPVVGDRGYDAVDLLERLQPRGARPALPMKGTWRYALRHPLRQASQKGWKRWGRRRYRVEGFFGQMKLKLGAVFPLLREDLAMRRALAAAVLYNLDRLALLLRLLLGRALTRVFPRFFDFSNSPQKVFDFSE